MNKGKVIGGAAIVVIVLVFFFIALGPLSATYLDSSTSTHVSTSTEPTSSTSTHAQSTSNKTTMTSSNSTTSSTYELNLSTSSTSNASHDTGSITVLGTALNGTSAVNGIRVDLRINGTSVAIGQTPVTFKNLSMGLQYGVVVYWYGNYYIRYINDSNTGMDLQRYDLVTLNQSNPTDQLTAVFEYVPPSQAASLNILAEFPNGTRLGTATVVNGYDLHSPGMWLTVTPPFQKTPYTGTFTGGSVLPFILFNHETYVLQMSYGFYGQWVTNLSNSGPVVCIKWDHWKDDGSTNVTRAVTLAGNITYIAVYDQVSTSACTSTTNPTAYSMLPNVLPSAAWLSLLAATPILSDQKLCRTIFRVNET